MVERVEQERAVKEQVLRDQLRDIPGYSKYLEKKKIEDIVNARRARDGTLMSPEQSKR